jgi:hypothetical protein
MRMKHKIRKFATEGTLPPHDDFHASRLLLMLRGSRNCSRCGGLLVTERLDSAADSIFEQQVSALRCIQCGDILDRVILYNRLNPVTVQQSQSEDAWQDEEPAKVAALPEVVTA